MTTAHLLTRVKPDPRGRLAFGKAIEAVNELLHAQVTGFDVPLNDDGSVLLKPTVEVPAESVIGLSRRDWNAFTDVIDNSHVPNAAALAAAEEYAAERKAGRIVSPLK